MFQISRTVWLTPVLFTFAAFLFHTNASATEAVFEPDSAATDGTEVTPTLAAAQAPAPVLPAGRNVLLASYLRAPAPEDTAGLRTMAQNFDILILHEWHASKIPTFRNYNPDIVVLLYKTRGFMFTDSQEGVANYYDVSQYDFAFMHDVIGNHIAWDWDLDGTFDAASPRPELPQVQDFFYSRALASVTNGGFDGLYLDDIWSFEGVQGTPDVVEYSNANSYEAVRVAMESFLESGFQRTRSSGQLMGVNIGWWQQITADGSRTGRVYAEHADVAMQEKFFMNYSTHWNTGSAWFTEITALIQDMRDTDRTIICNARGYANDRQAMFYALGSYLCLTDRDGRAALSYYDHTSSSRIPPLFAEYDLAEDLGAPLYDVRWSSARGCGYRGFANGYVIVNPNSTSRTIPEVGGMTDVYGNRVSSSGYTIPGYSAMIFFF